MLQRLLHNICHQNPLKTLTIAENSLPLCSRCSGIYIGLILAFIFILLISRRRNYGAFCNSILLMFCISLFLLLADILTSHYGLRETTNKFRFLLGLIFGNSVGFIIIPRTRNFFDNRKVIQVNIKHLGLSYTIVFLLFFAAHIENIGVYYILSFASISGPFCFGTLLNLTVIFGIFQILKIKRKINPYLIVCLSLVIFTLEIYLYGFIPAEKRDIFGLFERSLILKSY